MISKDQSIVTQVAAKIASELTAITSVTCTEESVQSAFLSHFDFVRTALIDAHDFDTATQVQEVSARNEQNIVSSFNASYESAGSSIQVKGIQHGPLPAWLVDACAKAGVTSVYDNRDTATPENRRPLFKAADGKMNAKGQPLAFWAPSPRR